MMSADLRSTVADRSELDDECAKAMALQMAGQLDRAGEMYRAILATEPNYPAANYCLGMLHVQTRRPVDALPFLKAALLAGLEVPDYWLGYLEALLLAHRTTAARNILALGIQHGLAGAAVNDLERRLEAAAPRAERLVPGVSVSAVAQSPALEPVPLTAPLTAATTTNRGHKDRVRKLEAQLLRLVGQGDPAVALALARKLTKRHPGSGLGWKILGAYQSNDGDHVAALPALEAAVRLLPEDAEAHVNLGVTLAKLKRFNEAERSLHKALERNPLLAPAHFRLGMILELQGRYAEAEASLRRGRDIVVTTGKPTADDDLSCSHLLFLMSHNPAYGAEELLAEHLRYGVRIERPFRDARPAHANDRHPNRILKVGFVSGDLYEHSVGQFLEPIAAALKAHTDLDLHVYDNNPQADALSRRLREHFSSWTAVNAMQDPALARRIHDDQIDVLVDLSGHTGHNRLPVFARKPAPIQVSWLGYPGTTGLSVMDYYFADEVWLPAGFERMFTEKLVYLPDRWAFQTHAHAPAVGPLPALSTGSITFGSFHRQGKINPATVALWSSVLRALPEARLLMVGVRVDGQESALRDRFASQGVDPDRITLHGRCPMDAYLAFHQHVDIALDTVPYAGATTTMHSLSMGVPTLTIAGPTPQGRACAGILGHVGLDSFIAADGGDFVVKALHWNQSLGELAALRQNLRTRMAALPGGQPAVIARHIAMALRHMWGRWCRGDAPESFTTG